MCTQLIRLFSKLLDLAFVFTVLSFNTLSSHIFAYRGSGRFEPDDDYRGSGRAIA